MPAKSPAQKRLMEGVAHNPKFAEKVGIPQSVGKEFVGDAKPKAAGIMFTTPDGLALFVKRSSSSDHPGEWAWPGGGVEDGETEEEAARREALEEVGHEAAQELEELDHQENDEVSFKTFHQRIDKPFLPELNGEHTAYAWAPVNDPVTPLHPGVAATLDALNNEDAEPLGQDAAFAFDRASVRRSDKDGRLHVETTNISKANVCPYLGREIPGWYEMGLDPNSIYKLYRDPDELAKAAPTFNNLPVLSEHVETNAENHPHKLVIGTTGTDADFSHPYLRNSMSFWDASAIDDIEQEAKKELSSAYRYRADMTPGTSPEGERYDGVMRDIVGNHVALVEEGRAGPDVVVGDSKKELKMKVSQKAMMVRGALASFIVPRLAADAKMPSLTTILLGVNAANLKDKKKSIEDGVTKALKGKLAKDASVEGLTALLDGLEKAPVSDDMEPDQDVTLDAEEDPEDPGVVKVEKPDPMAAIMQLLEGQVAPELLEQVKALCNQDKTAEDDPPPFKGMPKPGGKMVGDEESEEKEDKVDKAAMDAALATTRKETLAEATKNFNAIREAERAVAPYVGEVTQAFDSASDVYASALKALKVDIEGVHPSAYPSMLKMVPKPGDKKPVIDAPLGMDAAYSADFEKRFPGADRIRHV